MSSVWTNSSEKKKLEKSIKSVDGINKSVSSNKAVVIFASSILENSSSHIYTGLCAKSWRNQQTSNSRILCKMVVIYVFSMVENYGGHAFTNTW